MKNDERNIFKMADEPPVKTRLDSFTKSFNDNGLDDESDENNNKSVSHRKKIMNEKVAFSIKVREQLYKVDFSKLKIKIWDYDEFQTDFLSEGFYGTTYKAVYRPKKLVLVLKELKEYNDDDCINQFFDEIRLCCRLVHPNIIKTMGITFNHDGRVCCLLEYITGGSLWDLIQTLSHDYTLDVWLVYLNITLDIARGINYLHEQGVIHRDLSSKNVVVREIKNGRYQAIIIDFGLSYQKRDPQNQNEEAPTGPVGCAFYIAPELFGDSACSPKTDVFAFGIIICEMISGIAGADPEELPRSRDFGLDRKEFEQLVHDCPTEFVNLAVLCCQVNPDYRPIFADIIKMVDIIIDRTIEQVFENTDVVITPRGDVNGDGRVQNVSISSCSSDDEYILDECLLCSCRSRKDSTISPDEVNGLKMKMTYDRHGIIQKTSSRKLMQKYFRRCSVCAGRILILNENAKEACQTEIHDRNSADNRLDSIIQNGTCLEENDLLPNNRKKLTLDLNLPEFEMKTQLEDPLKLQSLDNTITLDVNISPSMDEKKLYKASAILRQSNYEITTRTTQLAQHTPGRLHSFFTHVLRGRKSNRQKDAEKRGSRLSLHKLFNLSTSPKPQHYTVERKISQPCANQSPDDHTKRRFTFSRSQTMSPSETARRRQSVPLQFFRNKASTTPNSPVREFAQSFPESNETYDVDIGQTQRTLRNGSLVDDNDDSDCNKSSDSNKKNAKRSKSFLDLFLRKKNSIG